MIGPSIQVFYWLIRDTFRQSLASAIFGVMIAVSTICILLCLTVTVVGESEPSPDNLVVRDTDADSHKTANTGVQVLTGELQMLFGLVRVPLARDRQGAIHFLQLVLAGGVADTFGLLLALVWTAGFLPSFLEAHAVSVLLAKPVPRWQLLAGKYLGALGFVLFHSSILIGGTWLALGWRTGVWTPAYLLAVPLLVFHFGLFYSFSLVLAVMTRATVTCVFGSVLFWFICWGINYGRQVMVEMVLQNEHVCAARDLSAYETSSYWRERRLSDTGKTYFVLSARHASKGNTDEVAYRYDKSTWTEQEAREHAQNSFGRSVQVTPALKRSEAEDHMLGGPLFYIAESTYWLLPKPADLGIILFDQLRMERSFAKPEAFVNVQRNGWFVPWLVVLASIPFPAFLVYAAMVEFSKLDY